MAFSSIVQPTEDLGTIVTLKQIMDHAHKDPKLPAASRWGVKGLC